MSLWFEEAHTRTPISKFINDKIININKYEFNELKKRIVEKNYQNF